MRCESYGEVYNFDERDICFLLTVLNWPVILFKCDFPSFVASVFFCLFKDCCMC